MTMPPWLERSTRALCYVTLVLSGACDHDPDHDHAATGKGHAHGPVHDGELVELGEDFAFLELLLDPDSGQVTCWSHGAHVKPGLRLKQESITLRIATEGAPWELTLQAQADELTGEKPGDSARFLGEDARLRGRRGFEGTIVHIESKGRTFENLAFHYDLEDDAH